MTLVAGAATGTLNLTEAGVDIIANTFCRYIKVQENSDSAHAATTDLLMAQPKGAPQIRVPKGTPCIFTPLDGGSFYPGQLVSTVLTASGGGTVGGAQIEQQELT